VIRIVIADDHPIVLDGLSQLFALEHDIEVVARCGDGEQALYAIRTAQPDVAVVDILMPTVSGISLTSELFELQPQCRVLGLSVIDDPGLIADMLRALDRPQPVGLVATG